MYQRLVVQFKKERKAKGMSQDDAALNCGVTLSAISKVERNKRSPKLETFMEMCKGIGFMVVMIPIPEEIMPELKRVPEPVEVKEEIDYDNWDYEGEV